MANLSWLFYKGYYDGFTYWQSQGKENREEIEKFFTLKNNNLCETDLIIVPEMSYRKLSLTTTYPGLLVGSGYSHETGKISELKLGFQFDHTYGMPVIPGSSVKGVIRSAFPQFLPLKNERWKRDNAEKETEIKKEKAKFIGQLLRWTDEGDVLFEKVHRLEQHIFEGLDVEQSAKENTPVSYSLYKRDIFYDAFPSAGGGKSRKKIIGTDAITPHGSNPLKNPTPLPFIKILPGVTIDFVFNTAAPDFLQIDWDKRMKLYHDILLEMGAGAKTNVGYGQLTSGGYMTFEEWCKAGCPVRRNIKLPAPVSFKTPD
jgi:CRISPR-associated protein Cmr6